MGVFDGVIGGALGAAGSIWNNERNIAFQRETNAHNEALMREAWGREDSAVQRRAADMEAAGINAVLATGATASSMPAVRAEAPEARENVGASALQGYRNAVDISLTEAQADLVRQQARKTGAEADVLSDPGYKANTISVRYWDAFLKNMEGRKETARFMANVYEDEAALAALKAQYEAKIVPALADARQKLAEVGASQAEIDKRIKALQEELLDKQKDWFTADKVFGAIGSLTGSAARVGTMLW